MESGGTVKADGKRTLDDVLTVIGDLGPYQIRVLVLLNLAWICSQLFMTLPAFDLAVPKHRCKILSNDSYEIQSDGHQKLIDRYIPESKTDLTEYEKCTSLTLQTNHSDSLNVTQKQSPSKCSSWVYDKETFSSTFVSEKDLVCDDRFLRSTANSVFYGGVLAGSFIYGVVSDLFGRRRTSLIGSILITVFSVAMAFVENYYAFVVIRFFLGTSLPGMFMSIYVIVMEWTGRSKRRLVCVVAGVIASVGECLMVPFAYLVRQRKYLQITITAPVVAFTVVVFFFLPESPRWLLAQGRDEDVRELLKKAATVNKKELDDGYLKGLVSGEEKETGRVYLLFKNWRLAVRTIIIFYCWMVFNMVIYGLILNTENLYGDFYINMLLFAITSILSNFPPYFLVDRFGRSRTLSCLMAISGLACLSTIFSVNFGGKELQNLTTALAMFGRFCAGSAYLTIYLFSAELYPTVVRNAGLGASSCCARIGSMISPFVAESASLIAGKGGQALPLVIFGGLTIIGAFFSLLLPETMNKKLPDSVEDAVNLGRKSDENPATKAVDNVTTKL
ncbi:hypothetical protein FSP39_005127 [Pinctada imbricata]|uniref:Major facilitator superfamily (MFS) profile domain-containing protein n=1 Tax=Pinctada imbricata TaxID=66713 RepID=A0AA88XL05_PINIB|nr:hypothetical protein FSP39_005127 [Pinctada imbricata]